MDQIEMEKPGVSGSLLGGNQQRKEQFTSFERFLAYNTNTSSPTVSLVLRYNFAIKLSGSSNAQEYVITVRLTSRVAVLQQLREDAPPFMRGQMFGFMAGPVVEVTVDYADYVVARAFLEAVDEWVKGCKATPTSGLLNFLQKYSHYIPQLAQLGTATAISFYAYQAVPAIFAIGSTPAIWAKFAIVFMGGSYICVNAVKTLGSLLERSIDSFPVLSYVHLNRGDEKLIDEARNNKPIAWLRLFINVVGTISLGVIASKLEKLI